MHKKDEFRDWLCDKYWHAHKKVEDLEHQRRYIEEELREARASLGQLESLQQQWLHEQEMKAGERK